MTPAIRRLAWGAFLIALTLVLALGYTRFVLDAPPQAFTWMRDGVRYQLLEPRMLGVVLILPLLLFVAGRSLADLPWAQRVISVTLRLIFLTLLGIGLGRPVRTAETQNVATVFLVDVSDSVPPEALEDARKVVEQAITKKRKDDVVKLVTFARRPRLVTLASEGEEELVVPPAAALRHDAQTAAEKKERPGAGSNLASALQLAHGIFPPGYLKRAVIVSDGVETEGDVLAEANRAREFGVKLFAVPYRRPPPGEVALRGMTLPDKVDVGESFEIVADIYASRATKARARLYQGETINGLDGVRELDLTAGKNEVRFKSVVRVGGEVTYRLEIDQIGHDKFAENNRYLSTIEVPGRPAVLYVEGQQQAAGYLSSALGAQQFDVDVRAPGAFPGSIKELERYAFVIVSDVPREAFATSSQDLIEKYVRDIGGGFLFAGGEAGYGLGGWQHTTIERILPVRMDSERRKEMPTVAMALVIDRSGSMTGLPIEMAKAACKATVSTLQGDDMIEVIAFDSQPVRYVKMQPARYRQRIQNDIMRISPGGGTEIFKSLDMAYQDMAVVKARKKHVILLTDGHAPSEGIRDLVQAMISEDITVTSVGLGEGASSDLLRMIAEEGGGRFHQVPDPNSLPKIFTRETEMISRQAAKEDWFPIQVTGSADFMRGIALDTAPYLRGYVATQLKGPPAQQLIASDTGEPILARWRAGLGWAIAWTSDVKNMWAVDWLRWSEFSKFWGQLVREHMRKKHRRELDMKTELVGGRVHATMDAFTLDDRFDNEIQSKLYVMGPQPKGDRREVAMRQTAPGRYEADFELEQYGSFLLRADHFKPASDGALQSVGVSYGHISNPYPREYASFEADLERLRRAVRAGGGALDPAPEVLFDPGNEKIVYYKELWNRLILAAILAFLLDLLVRRVRLFDRKFLPKARRA